MRIVKHVIERARTLPNSNPHDSATRFPPGPQKSIHLTSERRRILRVSWPVSSQNAQSFFGFQSYFCLSTGDWRDSKTSNCTRPPLPSSTSSYPLHSTLKKNKYASLARSVCALSTASQGTDVQSDSTRPLHYLNLSLLWYSSKSTTKSFRRQPPYSHFLGGLDEFHSECMSYHHSVLHIIECNAHRVFSNINFEARKSSTSPVRLPSSYVPHVPTLPIVQNFSLWHPSQSSSNRTRLFWLWLWERYWGLWSEQHLTTLAIINSLECKIPLLESPTDSDSETFWAGPTMSFFRRTFTTSTSNCNCPVFWHRPVPMALSLSKPWYCKTRTVLKLQRVLK